jgi:hypothetical protein
MIPPYGFKAPSIIEGTRSFVSLYSRTIRQDSIFIRFCPSFYLEFFIKNAARS